MKASFLMCDSVCVAGALLKAVCVCSDVVCFTSPLSLKQQLLQFWGGGLELHSWSQLPHGSGLGETTCFMLMCVGWDVNKSTKTIHSIIFFVLLRGHTHIVPIRPDFMAI